MNEYLRLSLVLDISVRCPEVVQKTKAHAHESEILVLYAKISLWSLPIPLYILKPERLGLKTL